ncbi:Na/Pi cotransporter family protein [Paenibacillus hexagrammi]|uniref:Na/Pi symporter n=1 Tax=Paenibacillus hexagrammi TaxID=2908839 RepID=A0ABY3SLX4_9BACL|nr:Na/Pi symporter [Paenibacillus sp. YPD9-1]UJF35062.1 Na/Pi symporter [Paenibacillus sp. YPD9-1]
MIIAIILPVLAGLAMFMFGMKLMETALQHWAGARLQQWLERFTRTPVHGMATSTALTAVLQSSTAITVIAIGLVNAGVLTFSRTLGIILGTNIGTCLTTELIGLNIGKLGMPMLLVSAGVWLVSWLAGPLPMLPAEHGTSGLTPAVNKTSSTRTFDLAGRTSSGGGLEIGPQRVMDGAAIRSNHTPGTLRTRHASSEALGGRTWSPAVHGWLRSVRYGSLAAAGFALVLLGIEIMQTIGPALQARGLFAWFVDQAQSSLLWGVLAGAAVTALVHSSAAVIAMAMSLAAIQSIPVELGVAITLGANIGTCVTALIAGVSGSRAGRFVAWSHILLNVGGAALFYPFIEQLTSLSALLADSASSQIARSQTIFNIACSLLALPLCYLSMWKRLESRS